MEELKSSFTYRDSKDQDKSAAKTCNVTYDVSGLSPEELGEWACRGIDIALQGKLRSGSVKYEDVNNKTYVVPKPGDRKKLSESDKIRKMIATLLGKDVSDLTDAEVLETVSKVMGK
jgi:hypothetical protein